MRFSMICFSFFLSNFIFAQNTPWTISLPNIGIGTTSPATPLEVKIPSANNSNIIRASGFSLSFDANRVYGTPIINSQIGLDLSGYDLGGFTYFNDGYQYSMGLTTQQKLICNYGQTAGNTSKYFRLTSPTTNLANYSLIFSTVDPVATSPYWSSKGGASIAAWNQPLNIGSYSAYPVRVYSDGGNANKLADIFIQNSQVGIGTETPNTNAKLDVNGNIYSNGKVFIGIADANTATKINTYSLAVNGPAIFTSAKVALYASAWPDYVFSPTYKLTALDSLEQFIKLNKHLPEVPTASDVDKNGIDLGLNQALLLKKIEELTLITIEQNKRIEKLELLLSGKEIKEQ